MREPYPNELYHHGIKDQKWGIRRYQNADGSLTPEGKRRYYGDRPTKEDRKAENRAIKEISRDRKRMAKNSGYLSDKEIREYINRLKLEKELKDLVNNNTARGNKYVNSLLQGVGKSAAERLAGELAGAFGKNLGRNWADKLIPPTQQKKEDKN